MKKSAPIILAFVAIFAMGLIWFQFDSPPEVIKGDSFSQTVESTADVKADSQNSHNVYTARLNKKGRQNVKESSVSDTLKEPINLPLIYALRNSENNSYAITCPDKKNKMDICRTIRFEVRPGDYAFNGSRSQIRLKNRHTRHIQFDLRLVKFRYQNNWFSLMDWHTTAAYQKEHPNLPKKNFFSPMALQVKANNLFFYNRANQLINRRDRNSTKLPLKEGWNHIDIKIKLAADETGALTVKVNNTEKKFNNVATTYDMRFSTFLKFGIYRSATYTDTSVVEFRDVIVDDSLVVPDFSRRAVGEHVVNHLNGLQKMKKN